MSKTKGISEKGTHNKGANSYKYTKKCKSKKNSTQKIPITIQKTKKVSPEEQVTHKNRFKLKETVKFIQKKSC